MLCGDAGCWTGDGNGHVSAGARRASCTDRECWQDVMLTVLAPAATLRHSLRLVHAGGNGQGSGRRRVLRSQPRGTKVAEPRPRGCGVHGQCPPYAVILSPQAKDLVRASRLASNRLPPTPPSARHQESAATTLPGQPPRCRARPGRDAGMRHPTPAGRRLPPAVRAVIVCLVLQACARRGRQIPTRRGGQPPSHRQPLSGSTGPGGSWITVSVCVV